MMDAAAAAFDAPVQRAHDWTANTVGSPTECLFGSPDPWGGYSLFDSITGCPSRRRVTGREALEQTAVLICLDVLSQDISKAPLRLKRKVKGRAGAGGAVEVDPRQHPVAEMLALEPNDRHTWIEWVQMAVFHLALVSNCYSYVPRDRVGTPLALIPLMPSRVQDLVNAGSRETFYDIWAGTEAEAALLGFEFRTAPERDILHIRKRMIDGFFGYSTLVAGGPTLVRGRAIDEYGRQTYESGGERSGYFVRDKDGFLNEEPFRRVKEQLRTLRRRMKGEGDIALLEDGIKWVDMAQTAADAEYIKALDAQIASVCRLFNMPPHKALHLNAVKYENLATMEAAYARAVLEPICRAIEARLARTLLTRQERLEFFFEFDRDALTIADEKLGMEEAVKMFTAGIITKNEARASRGWNPAEGGDVYNLPANTSLIDKDGEKIVSGASAAAMETDKPADGDEADQETEKPEDEAETEKSARLRLVG